MNNFLDYFLKYLFTAVLLMIAGVCFGAIFIGPSPILFTILIVAIDLSLLGIILSLGNKA